MLTAPIPARRTKRFAQRTCSQLDEMRFTTQLDEMCFTTAANSGYGSQMRAAIITNGSLHVGAYPDPVPALGEVLIGVRAAGLNNADQMQIAGFYPAPPGAPPDVPGLEFAGEVIGVGPGVFRYKVGDAVMGVVAGGGLAEQLVAHERTLMPVPTGIGWEVAGGFPEAFTTAHDALFTQCGLQMGERVLVHGAAGGVGMAAVQLVAAAGACAVASVRAQELRPRVESLFPSQITAVAPDDTAQHGPYDVIVELVGASNMEQNIRSLTMGGRISIIGVSATGAKAEIDLLALMGKRGRIHGSTLRARPLEQKADAASRVERFALPHLAAGRLQVPIVEVFPLARVSDAYARFAAGGKFGKIVVTP
jgi:NADPH:quinone reductase